MKQLKWILLAIPALLIACTSSKVTSSWKDPNTSKELASFKNILVVGMQANNRELKAEMENYLSDYLKSEGVTATSAYDVFGPKAFTKMSEDDIAAMVQKRGYDGVITIALLDKKQEKNYNPGSVSYNPVGLYYNRFGRYYSTIYNRIYEPGYYATSTNYFWETNLYDAKADKIIYSAQSKTFDPSSITSMSKEYGKVIVKDLSKNGLLSK